MIQDADIAREDGVLLSFMVAALAALRYKRVHYILYTVGRRHALIRPVESLGWMCLSSQQIIIIFLKAPSGMSSQPVFSMCSTSHLPIFGLT